MKRRTLGRFTFPSVLFSLITAATVAGCGGSSGGGEKTLTAIAVGPATPSVAKGATLQLTATGTYSDGTTADLSATSTWASATQSVATVSATGLLTAVAAGTSSVSATSSGVTGSQVATVTDRVVTSVAVTPATSDAIAGGAAVALTARATFADSTTADVTSQATWTTSLAGQVDVAAGSATAPAGALVGKVATLTASYGGQQGSAALRVVRGAPLEPSAFRDPLFPQQWHLQNARQKAFSDEAGLPDEDLRLSSAWQLGITGAVKVAVIDDGLEKNHPDLSGNMVDGSWNFWTNSGDPTPTRMDQAHGTAVSGIVAMVYGNGAGGMGIAPGAKLNGYVLIDIPKPFDATSEMFVKALGSYNPAFPNNPRSNDVFVFNQSYGSSGREFYGVTNDVAAQYASGVANLRSGKGAIYVRAAGNDFLSISGVNDPTACARANALGVSCANPSQDGEAALPYNVVIGALDASGKRAAYSTAGSALWVSAPGGGGGANRTVQADLETWRYEPAMVTADQLGCDLGYGRTKPNPANPDYPLPFSAFDRGSVADGNGACNYTNEMNGTSSATPSTTGAVALLLDANPALTWRDVKHVLARSARKVDAGIAIVPLALPDGTYVAEQAWVTNAAGYPFHNWYGFGAVDVAAALDLARDHVAGSLGTWKDSGILSSAAGAPLPIPDFSVTGALSRITVPASVATVEAIVVAVDLLHASPADLGIELTNPAGTTRSIVLNAGNGLVAPRATDGTLQVLTATLETNAFYGEPAAGEWTLKVVDGYSGTTGTLNGWKMIVYGH